MNILALLLLLTWVCVALFVEAVVVQYRTHKGLKPAYNLNTTFVWLWPLVSVAILIGAAVCLAISIYDATWDLLTEDINE